LAKGELKRQNLAEHYVMVTVTHGHYGSKSIQQQSGYQAMSTHDLSGQTQAALINVCFLTVVSRQELAAAWQ
jgi:hypothetical protein